MKIWNQVESRECHNFCTLGDIMIHTCTYCVVMKYKILDGRVFIFLKLLQNQMYLHLFQISKRYKAITGSRVLALHFKQTSKSINQNEKFKFIVKISNYQVQSQLPCWSIWHVTTWWWSFDYYSLNLHTASTNRNKRAHTTKCGVFRGSLCHTLISES